MWILCVGAPYILGGREPYVGKVALSNSVIFIGLLIWGVELLKLLKEACLSMNLAACGVMIRLLRGV